MTPLIECKFPGIYRFTNLINGKIYVGQAKDLRRRFITHKNQKVTVGLFSKAVKRYGIEGFKFEVIERVDNVALLNEREQYWLDYHQSYDHNKGYNICKIAGSTRGRKRPESETLPGITAIRALLKQNGAPFKGRKHSPESKILLSKARQGKPIGEAHLNALRKGYWEKTVKPVAQIDPTTGRPIKLWESAECASDALKIKLSAIRNACRGYWYDSRTGHYRPMVIASGFEWCYASKDGILCQRKVPNKKVDNSRTNGIRQINPTTDEVLRIWADAYEIHKELGLNPVRVMQACGGSQWDEQEKKTVPIDNWKGFRWEYVA